MAFQFRVHQLSELGELQLLGLQLGLQLEPQLGLQLELQLGLQLELQLELQLGLQLSEEDQ